MTYTELKTYAQEKYQGALQDHESQYKTYGIVNNSLEYRVKMWYAATKAKDKKTLVSRIKMAAYSTEELRFANSL